MQVINKLPEGKILVPGVITRSSNVVEHPVLVSQRIQRYAKRVGRENVMAGADCGFGGRSHPQIAWAKLQSLTRAGIQGLGHAVQAKLGRRTATTAGTPLRV